MKVDVVQVEDVKFGRFCYWSNWIDIVLFEFGGKTFLMQMKISRRNKKAFRSVAVTGEGIYRISVGSVGDLTEMKRS